MPNIDLSILNQRQTPAFYADTLANRPAAGFVGRIFVSTDTYAFYRDNGTSWDLIGGPGTGTITGSGSSGSLALWNGTNTITYDVNITWNGTDNSISADKFIVNSGTSSQFLKGDGSLDSSAYVTTNIYNGNGTLSGERTVSLNGNNLIFDGGASIARVRLDADTNVARIFSFATNNVARWAFRIDDSETGSNAGSNFAVRRYDDAGTFVDAPLLINRATGQSTFAKKVVIENNAGDQQLQIVSTTAPSLRIDNLQTGATKRIGLGLATAVNNFIQGSVDQDFCIFNSTTTASPILFGIYDAGLSNTQEAARISPARNFLIGTTTDAGQKLQVNGTGYISTNLLVGSNSTSGFNNAKLFVKSLNSNDYEGLVVQSSSNSDSITIAHTGSIGRIAATYGTGGTGTFTDLALATSGVDRLYITTIGNIGINTTIPTVPLQITKALGNDVFAINESDGSNIRFSIGQEAAYTGNYINSKNINLKILSNLSGGTGGNIIFYTGSSGVNVDRGRWTSSGNLLIGTTTDAGQKLQVNGTSFFNSDMFTNVGGGIFFNGGGSYVSGIFQNPSSSLVLRSGNADRFFIKNTGVINISSIPTSAAGLVSGDIYSNAGILTIVP